MNNTNELIYEKFDPYNDSGTYICQSLYNNKHPTNFIWYHIDYINLYQNKLSQFNISSINKIVTTYQQLIKLQKNIKKQIYLLNSFYNQKFNLLYITIKFYHNLTQYTYCNNIYNIQINYICYIRIPRKLLYNNIDEIQLIYFILFNGFYQFGQFYDDDNKINQSNLTKIYKTFFENLANQLNFKLFLNKTYLYIPCQYNLFKQLPNLNYTFQPLNILNYYIIIKYKFNCKQLNNKKIINLLLLNNNYNNNINKLKLNISNYNYINYMKLEKLVIENEKLIKLDCFLNESYTCNNNNNNNNGNYLVKWSISSHYIYYSRTLFNERIYINEKCQLIIHNVKLNDSNIYNCYIKNIYQLNNNNNNNEPWQLKISYRLKIEKSYYEWPNETNLFIGLLFLLIWSIFIIIIWLILIIYNIIYIIYQSKQLTN
ncbi:unnamed protein product [Schistosoma rodhaini]|nr:unnamed protein product [Schistosoma rodhaini]